MTSDIRLIMDDHRMSLGKRMLLFALIGPFIGFVMAFWVMLPLLTAALGDQPGASLGQLGILPAAYFIGALPAALTGAIDDLLARRSLRPIWRPLWTGLAGYLLGFAPILGGLLMGFMHGPILLLFGLIGAVPALVCSLVAALIEKRGANHTLPSR
jgi:hypothetical protein